MLNGKDRGGNKVRKRIIVAGVLAVLLAASAYAQTTNFFELVKKVDLEKGAI